MGLDNIGGGGRRIYGVVIGIVSDNKDPEGRHRIRAKLPWIRDTEEVGDDEDWITSWARIATPYAGKKEGLYIHPEEGDEVLIAFQNGHPNYPYVIGMLHNGVDKTATDGQEGCPDEITTPDGSRSGGGAVALNIATAMKDTKDNKKNRGRFIYTRSGHLLLFDDAAEDKDSKIVLKSAKGHVIVLNDSDGKEAITLFTSNKNQFICLDEKNEKITIESSKDIDILCVEKLSIEAKNIEIKSGEATEQTVGTDLTMTVSGASQWDTSGETTMTGSKINLN